MRLPFPSLDSSEFGSAVRTLGSGIFCTALLKSKILKTVNAEPQITSEDEASMYS